MAFLINQCESKLLNCACHVRLYLVQDSGDTVKAGSCLCCENCVPITIAQVPPETGTFWSSGHLLVISDSILAVDMK